MAARFSVDVDALRRTVDEMAACGEGLHGLADALARQVHALHGTWEGQAAVAQEAAQQQWEAGFRSMREALARMRVVAAVAHDNYAAAATANLEMWQRVR
jgi:WXG100 family type VII secretion target